MTTNYICKYIALSSNGTSINSSQMIKVFSAVSWTHFFTRIESTVTRGHNWKLMKKKSSKWSAPPLFLSPVS